MIQNGSRKYAYIIALLVGAAVIILTLVAILDLSAKQLEVPERLYAILAGASAFVFGLHLPDSGKPS